MEEDQNTFSDKYIDKFIEDGYVFISKYQDLQEHIVQVSENCSEEESVRFSDKYLNKLNDMFNELDSVLN